jgi:hypothetical protein
MRGVVLASVLAVAAATASVSRTDYLSLVRKFDSIEQKKVRAGSRIAISSQELNAYVATELPKVAPPGIRRPVVELNGNNTATGRALIDFVKLRSAQGKPPGWVLRRLLEGEHEVAVTTRVRSGGGTATVDIQRVEVAGIPVSGAALDFLIRNYLRPNYPKAKIGEPFNLGYGLDRIEVARGTAWVVMQ